MKTAGPIKLLKQIALPIKLNGGFLIGLGYLAFQFYCFFDTYRARKGLENITN